MSSVSSLTKRPSLRSTTCTELLRLNWALPWRRSLQTSLQSPLHPLRLRKFTLQLCETPIRRSAPSFFLGLQIDEMVFVTDGECRSILGQVAVKVQHSTVPASAEIDLATIAILLRGVRWMFPSVDYAWLAEESKRNLPLELDFLHEAGNAKRCSDNFAHRSDIVVPHVYREYSTKRVLTMSFEDGVSPTDATAVEDRGLSRYAVANVIASALNEQIFIHGFVHADPHPGNLLVRSSKSEDTWGRWLLSPLRKALGIHTTRRPELVILDHGLYREVSDELRVSYAKFWKAILNGDKDAMRACTGPLGAGDLYPLLACVLTRKPWDVIVPVGNGEEASSFDSNSVRLVVTGDPREISTLQGHFREYISQTFAMLAKVNPDLLLLLKTNDCIHHVLSALGSPSLYYLWVSRWTTEALRVAIHSHDDRTCMRTWALDQITGWLTALVEAVL